MKGVLCIFLIWIQKGRVQCKKSQPYRKVHFYVTLTNTKYKIHILYLIIISIISTCSWTMVKPGTQLSMWHATCRMLSFWWSSMDGVPNQDKMPWSGRCLELSCWLSGLSGGSCMWGKAKQTSFGAQYRWNYCPPQRKTIVY